MANFAYKGRDAAGKLIEGVLEGISSGAVADALFGRGITPLNIQETRGGASPGTSTSCSSRAKSTPCSSPACRSCGH